MGSTRTTNMAEAAVAVVQSVNETGLTASQFDTIYNVTSFGLACMMASTAFFFLRLTSFSERYKPALCYTGLVTFIAFYHYIVYTLFVGLKESQDAQPECVRDQVKWACWATVISWCTYPVVYILPMLSGSENGKAGLTASSMVAIQVGYTVSDVISKCGVGFLVYNIGLKKSMMERGLLDEDCVKADV